MCTPVEDAETWRDAGFSLIELPAGFLVGPAVTLPDGVQCRSTNQFFPGETRLSEDVDQALHLGKTLIERASSFGIKRMVIGSGHQRNWPDAGAIAEGEKHFLEVVFQLQEYASPHGIQLAPESLNTLETNVFNSLGPLFEAVSGRNVGITADGYHISVGYSFALAGANHPYPDAALSSYESWLEWEIPRRPNHVHLADRHRGFNFLEDPHVISFLRRLKKLGYEGVIALEGRSQNAASAREVYIATQGLLGTIFG